MSTITPGPNTPPDADTLARVRGLLRECPQIRLAILFGSLAAGTERADSDLDLAIAADTPLDGAAKYALITALAERIGRPVDLIDLRSVGEPLLGQILAHGIVIHGRDDPFYPELIKRHVFDQADFMPYRSRILRERRQAWIGQ